MRSQQLQHRVPMGYGIGPPWLFSGRAIYQLHLVKANVAKRFIPSDLKLVQAFGYTLGGMYLARYEDSPAGAFDEVDSRLITKNFFECIYILGPLSRTAIFWLQLVVIAGTVWNPPTSCAWAARVLVNSLEACDHGKKEVGLPSHPAHFLPIERPLQQQQGCPWWNVLSRFWSSLGHGKNENYKQCGVDILELEGSSQKPLCQITFPQTWAKSEAQKQWHGPSVSLSLPSFSGRTQEQPQLLKYSCQLNCSVKVVQPAIVTVPPIDEGMEIEGRDFSYNSIISLLAAKPLLALGFENMLMHVEGAVVVASESENRESRKTTSEVRRQFPISIKTS